MGRFWKTLPVAVLCLLATPLPEVGWAQGFAVGTTAPSDPFQAALETDDGLIRPRYLIESQIGSSIGVDDGSAGVSAFVPFNLVAYQDFFFIDARAYASFEQDFGGNLGAGYRLRMAEGSQFAGMSVWLDYDAAHQESFSQLGISLEWVSQLLEARTNIYLPIGDQSKTARSNVLGSTQPFFREDLIYLITNRDEVEHQMWGGDFELGGPVPFLGRFGLSAFAGAYILHNDNYETTVGVQGRATAEITDLVQVGWRGTYDDEFGSNNYATVQIRSPRYPAYELRNPVFLQQRPITKRYNDPVVRNYRIPVATQFVDTESLALSAVDGTPLRVLHVDPSRVGGGDGTFENPLGTTDLAGIGNNANIDIIHIFPGRTASPTLTNTGSFALLNNQQLLSSVPGTTFLAQQGLFPVPGSFAVPSELYSPATFAPIIQNGQAGSVITVANNNRIGGVTVDGSLGGVANQNQGIVGSILGTNSFSIHNSTVQNATNGIVLPAIAGTIEITNTVVNNNTGNGVSLARLGNQVVNGITVTNSTFTNNGNFGINLDVAGDTQVVPLTITGSTLDNNDDGIFMIVRGDAHININLNNSSFSNNLFHGIHIAEDVNSANDLAMVTGTISNNTITGNGDNGIEITAFTNINSLTLQSNTISNNLGNGVAFSQQSTRVLGPSRLILLSNTIEGNGLSGVDIGDIASLGGTIQMNGAMNVTLAGNNINQNNNDGLEFNNDLDDLAGARISTLVITDTFLGTNYGQNTFVGNGFDAGGGRGIEILNQGNAISNVTINNALVQNNNFGGITAMNTSSLTQTQTGDTLATTRSNAGALNADNQLFLTITNTFINGNGVGSGFQGTGLAILVGTAGGGDTYGGNTGIYTILNPSYTPNNDPANQFAGGFAGDIGVGVVANVTGNTIVGNLGDDFYTEAFLSTGTPAATAGAWTAPAAPGAPTFNPSGYQADPLARLDLTYANNNVTSVANVFNNSFYNNADQFKSHALDPDRAGLNPDGPFASTSRQRDATRLAYRDNGTVNSPTPAILLSDNFLFSGVGPSTFRLLSGSNGIGAFDTNFGSFIDGGSIGTTTNTLLGTSGFDVQP